ncbi:MAG: Fe-Mn family superoxide dismutase [Planctomycetota bacterium]
MTIQQPALPYAFDALAPHLSQETLELHYGKHHAGYVSKLNAAIEGTPHAAKDLETLIRERVAFNNAAQTWNHTFYWNSMSPSGGGAPQGPIAEAIEASFGGFAALQERFNAVAGGHFASGWAWLARNAGGGLEVLDTHDAETLACRDGVTPLLVCDVWEHAYYVDYRNARGDYVKAWWELVNWDFANANLG